MQERAVERRTFSTAGELRDWLDGLADPDTVAFQSGRGCEVTLSEITLSDGSDVYDLLIRLTD